jgi:nitrogen fixation NifU-like protein
MINKISKDAYSKQVVEHSMHPRNRGIIKNPDAHGKGRGLCGDETDFFVKIGRKKVNGKEVEYIKDIKFETMGCSAAIAAASMVTEMIKGKSVSEALKISRGKVIKKLGSMPLVKLHCVDLTIDAILDTIKSWQNKKK